MVFISPKPISLDGCFQSRISQTLQSLLCSLCLLSQAFLLDSVLGSFTGGAELINFQLAGCFGFDDFKYSHACIYFILNISVNCWLQGETSSFDSKAWYLVQNQLAFLNQTRSLERHSANGLNMARLSFQP